MEFLGLFVIMCGLVPVLVAELCREKVCEYEFMIHAARTMVYYNKTSGKSYEAELDGSDLVLAETLLIKKESHPDLVGRKVPSDDVITGDGVRRDVIAINGKIPGPTIEVTEGAEIVVHVTNLMYTDGVTLHWHGIHQYKTPFMDGTAGITQCPISPKQSFTYRFKAEPAGTHWYHPHLHYQRADGGYGMIIIHKSEPMIPHHIVMVTDWFHRPMSELVQSNPYNAGGFHSGTGGMASFTDHQSERKFSADMVQLSAIKYQSALINGRGRSPGYEKLPLGTFYVKPDQKYIFRIACPSAEYSYILSIDQHKMALLALDGQEIEPIPNLTSVVIAPGERFDVEITADQTPDQYWLRADSLAQYKGHYGTKIGETLGTKAVLVYDGHSGKDMDPEDRRESCTISNPCKIYGCPWEYYPDGENRICIGLEDVKGKQTIRQELEKIDSEISLNLAASNGASINRRRFVEPKSPLLGKKTKDIEGRCSDSACTSGCTCTNIYDLPLNTTVQLVLTNRNENSMGNTPHSVHIHGYQVYILKVGYSQQNRTSGFVTSVNQHLNCSDSLCTAQRWVNEPTDLNIENPPLRDTFVVPAGGYVVARFKTYNPEGMAMVINVGDGHHPPLPEGFPSCYDFTFSSQQYMDYMKDANAINMSITRNTTDSINIKDLLPHMIPFETPCAAVNNAGIGIYVWVGLAGMMLGIIVAISCTHCARNKKDMGQENSAVV